MIATKPPASTKPAFTPFKVKTLAPIYDTYNGKPIYIPQGWQVKIISPSTIPNHYRITGYDHLAHPYKLAVASSYLDLPAPQATSSPNTEVTPDAELTSVVADRPLTPRIYQEYGVTFLLYKQAAILADAPGVGKTLQALTAASRVHEALKLGVDPLEFCYSTNFNNTHDEKNTHPTIKPEWANVQHPTWHKAAPQPYIGASVNTYTKKTTYWWNPKFKPVTVIVAPGHLCSMWYKAIVRQFPNEYVVLATGGGSNKAERLAAIQPGASFYIVNYEMMREAKPPKESDYTLEPLVLDYHGTKVTVENKVLKPTYKKPVTFVDKLNELNPVCVIFDEAHRLKSAKSKQAKVCAEFAQAIPYRFLLTATPIKREADDMYFQLHIVDPNTFEEGHYTNFVDRFCFYKQTSYGKRNIQLKDSSKRRFWFNRIASLEELADSNAVDLFGTKKASKKYTASFTDPNLQGYVLGRSYKDVGLYLPPVIPAVIPVQMDPPVRKLYDQLKNSYRMAWNEEIFTVDSFMGMLHGLRILTACPAKYAMVDELIEDNEGPFVIYTEYKPSGQWLAKQLDTPFISGDIPESEREQIIENTIREGKPVVGMGRVIGTGINALADAKVIINFEHDYTPGERTQRIGRVQRYSANRKEGEPILLFDVMCTDTIDEQVYETQRNRGRSIRDIIAVELGLK